jgi:FtsH-binding integral membrane protein
VILLGSMFTMRNPTAKGAGMLYWTIVSLIGASLGVVLLRYTGESVASTFFVTAAAFGALSLFGYTTKKDLTGFGSFLIVGLFGLIIASLVSIFFPNPMLIYAINAIGVLIFAGLIAYDTQRLKMTYYQLQGHGEAMGVATSFGALSLYLNFINLFQFLLAFMGQRE